MNPNSAPRSDPDLDRDSDADSGADPDSGFDVPLHALASANDHERRFANLLALTAIATYLLIALGTAVSATGSATTCTSWPSCSADWTLGPVTADGLLFWGHRTAALVAGVLLAATAITAWRLAVDRRIGAALGVAVVCYPIQIALGATLVTGGSTLLNTLHLLLAMVIFTGLLVALVLALEAEAETETGDPLAASSRSSQSATPASEFERDAGSDAGLEPADSGLESTTTADLESPTTAGEAALENSVEHGSSTLERAKRTLAAYYTLTKPRLMWLLCLVAAAGIALATLTGESIALGTAIATLFGGVLAVGASGTFNHVYERDRDRKMSRTADRPLVHDRVPIRNAIGFGLGLVLVSMAVLLTWVNALAAALTLAAVVYYAVLYTVVLKPNTSWNTVLGGGAGAIPALIGWAAVTGSVGLPAVVLAALIFWWTPAHFYSFAIAYRDDYARGGFPMFPVVEGTLAARRHVVLFLGATLLSASLLGWLAGLGGVYALTSVALGGVFLRSVVRQYRVPTDDAALRSFFVSNYYLGAILAAVVLEALVFAG